MAGPEDVNKWQRWIWIMRLLDRKGATPQALAARLEEEKRVKVSVRTIQRDLNEMSECLEIESTSGKPAAWRWRGDSPWRVSPEADATQAVAWTMLERMGQDLLPPNFLDALAPFFKAAKKGVTQRERMWLENVRVIPTAFSLKPPTITAKVRDWVCEALRDGRQISFDYRRMGEEVRHYDAVNPLGLVQRDRELILVATHAGSGGETREFLLHRIVDVRLIDRIAVRPAGFSLDDYIAKGGFQYSDGTLRKVTLEVAPWLGVRLKETPLSDDQKIEPTEGGRWTVTATVPNSRGFEWWLMTMGEDAVLFGGGDEEA